MQVGNVSWIAQPFVFGRCSNVLQEKKLFQTFALKKGGSPEKKARQRKTKEERREMVESFIDKYRSSNNGSFPSLNLTHKEVGGSFYIIREIVRDIIQENRILGPGSMDLTALSFDDYADPIEESLMHEIDEENVKVMHMSDQNQDGENCGSVGSHSDKASPMRQNIVTVQQILDSSTSIEAGPVNSFIQEENGAVAANLETSLGKQNRGPSKSSKKYKRNEAVAAKLETSLGKQNGVPPNNSKHYELDNTDESIDLAHLVSVSDKEIMSNDSALEDATEGANLSSETNDLSQTNGTTTKHEHVGFPGEDASSTVDHVIDAKQLELNVHGVGPKHVADISSETSDPSQTNGQVALQPISFSEKDAGTAVDQICDEKLQEVNIDILEASIVADGAAISLENIDPSVSIGAFTSHEHVIFQEKDTSSTSDQITDENSLPSAAIAKENNDSNLSSLGKKESSNSFEISELQKPIVDVDQLPLPTGQLSIVEKIDSKYSLNSVDTEMEKLPSQGLVEFKQDTSNVVNEDASQFAGMISASMKKDHIVSKAMHERNLDDSTWISKAKGRELQNEEETNPVWAFIKALVAVVVKFCTK